MPRLNITLPQETIDWVRDWANERGISMAAIIKVAVYEFKKKREKEDVKGKK